MSGTITLPLDPDTFLATCWQRQPRYIPAAVPDFAPPLSRHELAGLALEDAVESRIVEQSNGQQGGRWRVQHGPFAEADFTRASPWTLLVQAVDHYVPAVYALRDLVDFLPGWRIDDVMVSYGTDGASVGPHYDNYDVFLLQGEGHKLWRVGQRCDADTALLDHDELRILRDFQLQDEFLLGPGDMLYVPPGVAHWGIAAGESTTFSIGFRAPRLNDMLSRFTDDALERLDPEQFFQDAGRSRVAAGGEIAAEDVASAKAQLIDAIATLEDSGRWLGELVTEPREAALPDGEDLAQQCAMVTAGPCALRLEAGTRLAWIRQRGGASVFANGQSIAVAEPALHYLQVLWREHCLDESMVAALLDQVDGAVLVKFLIEAGSVYVEACG